MAGNPLAASDTGNAPGVWARFWADFRTSRAGMAGLVLAATILLLALLAPLIAPHGPTEQFRDFLLLPPVWADGGNWSFPLGTDDIGRCLASRLLYGAQLSLYVGALAVFLSAAAGVPLGLVAAAAGGVADGVIMRLMDIFLALPGLLLAIAIVAVLGPGLTNAMLAIAVVLLPGYVRLVRAAALQELAKDYVAASRQVGAGPVRIMIQDVLPNCLAPVIVQATLGFSTAILDAAGLGFLGLGAQPPTPEWGTMLAAAREFMIRAPWTVTFPGLAILFTVLAFNLLGDGLRDALDPKLKERS